MNSVDWSGRHEDSSKMLTHFLRAWADSRKQFSVLGEYGYRGDPQERSDEEAPRTACGWSGNQQLSLTANNLCILVLNIQEGETLTNVERKYSNR
ncbi:hypothetical protein [Bacillus salipaludis]|uniref:Uncharacterized protein n=1 Tax=Bacillus salipaludis TaxID=2547811 RepID=A0AA90R5I3_9BACI|nr:hypothetical protein [Bacillus salipaludis]MDQ6599705.1 hypothetical protein [Bacillus salipaludis]